MELNPEDTKTPEITLFEIINDEKQKENHVADQFFRSLLVLLCYKLYTCKRNTCIS